ncbi:SRPBCC domain-containing protein [Lacihabitans soyangensis]|uniref:ATPase n=1 Tax=Lacihabitans soyangensis TaxID=869394 RepID=A0AAE3H415_9BACT|nr:SRPBCC domain-containing protein [Lacihabitans soyangensis]MCP9763661.1 ATPase [Lacihabitans soyangensis]
MERKTKIHAEENKQEIIITRDFDLPLNLLFRAYLEPEIVEQWMGTKVIKLENKKQGGWHFETTDPMGNVHVFSGVIHDIIKNSTIVRTFQMENTPFEPQLEFLDFEPVSDSKSKLNMHIIYRSVALRDQMLALPFAQGINMAHNRLQSIVEKLN